MPVSSKIISNALFRSLVEGPLLIGDLPEAGMFPYGDFVFPEEVPELNLQQKLGHLYEDALAEMITVCPAYELLERSLQIRRTAGATLGEMDFLLRGPQSRDGGALVHLELAIKFYLAVETVDGIELPGPDARDNYYKKLERMRTHQLILAGKYRELLPEIYREEPIATRQLVYGCLFDHVHAKQRAEPDFIHPRARRGLWLRYNECRDFFPEGTLFEVIPKQLWPVPGKLLAGIPLERWDRRAALERCVMLRVNKGEMPYFIAPEGYPEVGGRG
ncbi:DUF1853 family protein [Luteolibacter algae]|uniref:DUF1853 family protein n=2 Tax=Luteolibacter algae TaxID=454151 RepID=A0ABW5DA93_9BACT